MHVPSAVEGRQWILNLIPHLHNVIEIRILSNKCRMTTLHIDTCLNSSLESGGRGYNLKLYHVLAYTKSSSPVIAAETPPDRSSCSVIWRTLRNLISPTTYFNHSLKTELQAVKYQPQLDECLQRAPRVVETNTQQGPALTHNEREEPAVSVTWPVDLRGEGIQQCDWWRAERLTFGLSH